MLLGVLDTLVVLPLHMAFYDMKSTYMTCYQLLVSAMFVADIVLNFMTGEVTAGLEDP